MSKWKKNKNELLKKPNECMTKQKIVHGYTTEQIICTVIYKGIRIKK